MKALAIPTLLIATSCAATSPEDSLMQGSASTEQHEWLQQFLGKWKVSTEAVTTTGAEPASWEGIEQVRSIGKLWIIAESSIPDDESFASMMTIGFDPEQGNFVASWVDSMQTKMWTYKGTLDEDKRILTFSAEGPAFSDPSKKAQYRDQLEWIDADHRRINSSIRIADGEWQSYMTANYERKK